MVAAHIKFSNCIASVAGLPSLLRCKPQKLIAARILWTFPSVLLRLAQGADPLRAKPADCGKPLNVLRTDELVAVWIGAVGAAWSAVLDRLLHGLGRKLRGEESPRHGHWDLLLAAANRVKCLIGQDRRI